MCSNAVSIFTVFPQLAKLFHYASYERLANCAFVVFTIMFVITRLVILPFWLTWSIAFDISTLFGPFPALYIYTGALVILQVQLYTTVRACTCVGW